VEIAKAKRISTPALGFSIALGKRWLSLKKIKSAFRTACPRCPAIARPHIAAQFACRRERGEGYRNREAATNEET
jgi:hypothetical protein